VNGRHPTRRGALCCGAALAAGLFTGLVPNPAAASLNPFRNPCRGALPPDLAKHDLVLSAFDGIEASRMVDVHSHLLGTGDSGSGCSVNEQAFQWWHPTEVLRRKVIMNAACVVDEGAVDRAYVDGLVQQAEAFPAGARWWLFAFARAHDDQGRERADWTTFHVPNAYAAQVAGARPQRFRWVASVHPYAPTALQDLDTAIAGGAVAVKWLPSAMNIDLRDARCRPFYERLQRAGLPLIVHCGEEKAAPGADREALGNPLLVRVPLGAGVRVIVAHAASLGHAHDIDKRSAPRVASFPTSSPCSRSAASRRSSGCSSSASTTRRGQRQPVQVRLHRAGDLPAAGQLAAAGHGRAGDRGAVHPALPAVLGHQRASWPTSTTRRG
jgi:hypothetical protein